MKFILLKLFYYISLLFINLFLSIEIHRAFFVHSYGAFAFFEYVWLSFFYLFFYFYNNIITSRMSVVNESYLIIKSNFIAVFLIFSILFVLKKSQNYSRVIIILYLFLNFLIPFLNSFIWHRLLKLKGLKEKILVFCDDEGEKSIKEWFCEGNDFGFEIQNIINISKQGRENAFEELKKKLQNKKIYALSISLKKQPIEDIFNFIDKLQYKINKIIFLPDIEHTPIPILTTSVFNSLKHKGLAFYIKNDISNPFNKAVKRFFDIILSLFIIIFLSPFWLILYFFVFVSTKGKPIFKHERIGYNGKNFKIYKFRTMRIDAKKHLENLIKNNPTIKQEWEKNYKLKKDPRITKVGSFLRKMSLDEFPQIINVLKGDMSFIGPRPIIKDEIEKYGDCFSYFKAIKPGITGLWQVSGRNDIGYKERVQLDVWYTRNWSIELDFMIIIKTLIVVIRQKGSY